MLNYSFKLNFQKTFVLSVVHVRQPRDHEMNKTLIRGNTSHGCKTGFLTRADDRFRFGCRGITALSGTDDSERGCPIKPG